MYLSILTEKEKQLFLNLAYTLAYSDGEFGDEEKLLLDAYCNEMGTTFDRPETAVSLNELLESLKRDNFENIRKVVYFELLGLAVVDGKYSEEEKKVMDTIREIFGLSREFADQCYDFLTQYLQLQERLTALLLG